MDAEGARKLEYSGSFNLAENLMRYQVEVDESLPWPAQEAIRQRRWRSYHRQLEKLKHRISGPAYRQFALGILDKSLHDARLLSFQAGDAFAHVPDGAERILGRGSADM